MIASNPGKKTYLVPGLIFIVTLGTVIHIVQHQTNSIVSELTLNRVQTANHSFANYLSEFKDRVVIRAELISGDEAVVAAMKSGNYESLKRFLHNFSLGMDLASVCDSRGIVLARSHTDTVGGNITGYRAVAQALETGRTSTSIEEVSSDETRLSIYASAPIYDGGTLIGAVNCVYDLTQRDFLEVFREQTGCESSIFLNNERVNTTIRDESGNRAKGSQAPDFIVKTVIEQQKEYLGHLDLYGRVYGVCYTPLLDNGGAIGMLFTGVDIHSILNSQKAMNVWIILASVIGVAALAAFIVISNILARKYARLAERQLNQQMLMAKISRSFLSDTNTDILITATLRMLGEFMGLSRLLFFKLEKDGLTLTCRDEWINPGLGMESLVGSKLPLDANILSMIKMLSPRAGKDSCMNSDDMVFKKAMAPYRLNGSSFITMPIFIKGELMGVIDFSGGEDLRKWSDSDKSLATLFASTLSGVFEREAMGRRTSIVENSPHMIFYADSQGGMAYANPAVSAVTGYSQDELKAGGFGLILDEQTVHEVKEVFVPQTLRQGMIKHNFILLCKDGRRRILDVTSFIVKDGMIAAICIDMTEMRAMETELINAKNKADQASRAKSEFLSNMSHEMRTPMNAIIGMTVIAKNAQDADRKVYALNKVEEASKHLLGIINDVLDMTKIEANKLELNNEEFDLRSVLQRSVSFVNFRMEEKHQQFSMNVDGNVPFFCMGDAQRLTQVITNLLSNAVKFTPEAGRIGFDVSLAGEKDDLCELRFMVSDSGIGISPDQWDKIFNVFEQADNGITRKYGGTGLGLPISKLIVELMGGRIAVDSEKGKGSRFIFTVQLLRLAKEPGFELQADLREDLSGAGKSGEFTGKKLLLAEDMEINREILIALLEDTGLIIDTAENGREALEKITAAPGLYDLVFMDMQMPEMDGLEAARRIRAAETELNRYPRNRLPIIAMTANVFKEDIENCLAAGMDDHIGKPLDIATLFAKLRKFLQPLP